MDWPRRCRFAMALLFLLTLWSSPAAAVAPERVAAQDVVLDLDQQLASGAGMTSISMAPEASMRARAAVAHAGILEFLPMNYDAAVGDVTITADRASHVDFTMPYTESGVSLLVLTENDSEPTIEWIFLKPLTRELWIATVGFFLLTALVVWIIERPKNLEYQGSSSRQFSTALYFAFSTLTFSHGQIIRSPLSKIVVVIWCFVVLVLVQSYTTSLSSMLTAKRLRPSVTDLDQLLSDGDYVGYQHGSFVHSVLTKRGFSGRRLISYNKKEEYAEALRKGSKKGGVSAIVDEIPYLTCFLSDPRYQKEFQMVNRIYKTPGFGFVFPQGFPLVHNLSTAILDLTGGDEGSRIEAKWLGTAALSQSYGSPNTDSTPLTLRSLSGLFIITGCISALMLLISIAKSVLTKYTKVRYSDMQNADGDGGSESHGESSRVQNGMDNGSVPDQPHHENGNDNSQGVDENAIGACGEEPGPMQNGSVPANSTQDVMNIVRRWHGHAECALELQKQKSPNLLWK